MEPYFLRTSSDEKFYARYIAPRLPSYIFDVHVHINLPEHTASVPRARLLSDWALESGHLLPCEDAYACAAELYPGVRYRLAGMPLPVREADLKGNNLYCAEMARRGFLKPFMVVRPDWSDEEIERILVEGEFVGFKPYPDIVTGVKGCEMSIFEFFPHWQWKILDRYGKAVMLHLPRRERFSASDNIRELRRARDLYPNVKIIIAHFGRCFCPAFLTEGLDKLGNSSGFHFDTSAVINPAVYDIAFDRLSPEQILYGSDMPILFWHGRREWTEREYTNLCRENFCWNQKRRSPEEEARYTLFLYEQVRAILDAMDRHGFSEEEKTAVFSGNGHRLLGAWYQA